MMQIYPPPGRCLW